MNGTWDVSSWGVGGYLAEDTDHTEKQLDFSLFCSAPAAGKWPALAPAQRRDRGGHQPGSRSISAPRTTPAKPTQLRCPSAWAADAS